ncbi:hypothetical protein ASZ78_008043 [Callipepla squamata]|uniref:WD repeat-containing protein 76 n=1 Tax=Callipepla squamata TaxID=9009 RepID=A0A226N5E0_CALSU|nr:hypothetical protein ASZ78_008043 [Callipepla squamata]
MAGTAERGTAAAERRELSPRSQQHVQKRLLDACGGGAADGAAQKRPRSEPSCSPEPEDGGGDDDEEERTEEEEEEEEADGSARLSAYERKRLKNIAENARFFAALKLHEVGEGGVKPRKAEAGAVQRRSMRLQRMQPPELPPAEAPAQEEDYQPQVPAGPLPMAVDGQEERGGAVSALLGTWLRLSEMKDSSAEKRTCDMERYCAALSSMQLHHDGVRKVLSGRVCSVAIHPSESSVLVAAGDKDGHVGLWDVSCGSEGGVHVFTPHNFSVNCMHFSPSHPAQLLSLSHDSLRCGDVSTAVFDEICRSEDNLSSFDFLDDSACTALVGFWDGTVAVVDRRTPRASPELSADIGFQRTRTVDVHPVSRQYFVAAGSVVYDTSSLSSTAALISSIRHNNNTGRWLTRFRAVWDPKQEQCFVVGSMARPRQIEVFRDSGVLLHAFSSAECLGSVCSINALHPTRNVLVGGNSSGRLHVFMG